MNALRKVWLFIGFWLCIYPAVSYAQGVEAPVYRDGDRWRIKQEVSRVGFDVSGTCTQAYAEYMVRIVGGKPKVFGLARDTEAAIECPLISGLLFGAADLKFPLDVGSSWSDRRSRQVPGMKLRWIDYQHKVTSREKIKTLKGDFDAFKIVKSFLLSPPPGKGMYPHWQPQTYYYAPSVKAIVQYRAQDEDFT
jgi:hypothetical protein